jgi:hypothetical protein
VSGAQGNVPPETIDRPLIPDWLQDMWHAGRVLVHQPDAATGGQDAMVIESMDQARAVFGSPTIYYQSMDPGTGSDMSTTINWRMTLDENGNAVQQIVGRHCVIDESGGLVEEHARARRPAREQETLMEAWGG